MKRDLSGNRYGKLTVVSEQGRTKNGHVLWDCICDCGKHCAVRASHLVSEKTKSCGCLQREITIKMHYTHGKSNTRIFRIWQAMKNRCTNPKDDYYSKYGGKGIRICQEWFSNFMSFYNWSMENGYTDKLSIDRIDIEKDYCPENCRWATPSMQSNNKSDTNYVTYHGNKTSFTAMCRILNVNRSSIQYRCRKYNCTFEEAVDNFGSTPKFVENWIKHKN